MCCALLHNKQCMLARWCRYNQIATLAYDVFIQQEQQSKQELNGAGLPSSVTAKNGPVAAVAAAGGWVGGEHALEGSPHSYRTAMGLYVGSP